MTSSPKDQAHVLVTRLHQIRHELDKIKLEIEALTQPQQERDVQLFVIDDEPQPKKETGS